MSGVKYKVEFTSENKKIKIMARKILFYFNNTTKGFLIAFGILLVLLVSNTVDFSTSGTVMNGDTLLAMLENSGSGGWKISYRGIFHIGFQGHHVGYGTDGIFNPLAQKIVAFVIALAGAAFVSFFCSPKREVNLYSLIVDWCFIALKAIALLASIILVDYISFYHRAGFPLIAVIAWLAMVSAGGYVFAKLNQTKFSFGITEFAFLSMLLFVVLVMNHKTYCAQPAFERPLLSAFTPKCEEEGTQP